MIERQMFISNLFNSKNILNNFNELEFESFNLFLKAFQLELFSLSKEQILLVPIRDIKEFDIFVKLIKESYLADKSRIILDVKPDLLRDVFERCKDIKNKRFGIITSSDIKYSRKDLRDIEGYLSWTVNNPLYIEININYDNIEEMVSRMVYIYIRQAWRFFKLNFDYESFNKMTLDEVHKLEFWLFEINNWVRSSNVHINNRKIRENQQAINFYNRGFKTMFISDSYRLYLNKQAFEEGEILFDLSKHIDHNGEQVPYKELNKLRGYIDLTPDLYGFNRVNKNCLDFYQNLKIMGHINEIPVITKIIGGVLTV